MFKQLLVSILGLLSLSSVALANEAHQSNQPEVTPMQALQLDTNAGTLAANLYLPEGYSGNASEKLPVVVVTGAWTTVKEQMAAVYAKALADKGYAALTFDFEGWGESGKQNTQVAKYLEDPVRKTENIRAVIEAVSGLPFVDDTRIAGVAVCASSGYMLDAALNSDSIKAVAVVAPWLHDKAMATAIYGGEQSVQQLLAASASAKVSNKPVYIEAASLTNESALMYQAPYYTEKDRGLIPEYDNKFNVASWDGWLNYDAQLSAATIDKPVLMVASKDMALPAGAEQYLEKAQDNVKAVWFDGYSQFDFYDQANAVSDAVNAIDQHFKTNL
ncbi:alpha/beta hydrolase [Thalassotalea euphylliae]|uniref:alpha/beta hydrolase n=1 Tax=Thalassotalea euphylliae TaxID=1655234 RepID=UPI0036364FE6